MDEKVKELYLAHHGILGQKWGVRRYQNEDRTYTEEGKLRYSKNYDGAPRSEWKGKDAKDLSDKELRDRISRLQLEKAYTQLFETPKVKNDGSQKQQKQQKQNKKGEGVLKKIFFATAVTAMSNIMQDKYKDKFSKWYDKVFKKKAKEAAKDTVKDAAENVAKSAAKTAKKAAKTAADTIDWDTYLWQTFRHSDEEGLSFLDMTVGDLCLDHSDDDFLGINVCDLYLEHHGILGQKWGVRRYQNEDGSLTAEGMQRYIKGYGENRKLTFSGKIKLGREGVKKYNEYTKNREQLIANGKAKAKETIDELERSFKANDKEKIKEISSKMLKELHDDIDLQNKQFESTHDIVGDKRSYEQDAKTGDLAAYLMQRISKMSCDWYNGDFKTKETREIREKIMKNYEKRDEIYQSVVKKYREKYGNYLGKHFAEFYKELLENKAYQQTSQNKSKLDSELMGQILREIGFPDTKDNRKFIVPYVYID